MLNNKLYFYWNKYDNKTTELGSIIDFLKIQNYNYNFIPFLKELSITNEGIVLNLSSKFNIEESFKFAGLVYKFTFEFLHLRTFVNNSITIIK